MSTTSRLGGDAQRRGRRDDALVERRVADDEPSLDQHAGRSVDDTSADEIGQHLGAEHSGIRDVAVLHQSERLVGRSVGDLASHEPPRTTCWNSTLTLLLKRQY